MSDPGVPAAGATHDIASGSGPILILPGFGNSGPRHWQTAWERRFPGARRVPARDWDNPVCADWVASLEAAVGACSTPPVLVAHSLGCLQVVHWAASTSRRARAALLVAPPNPERADFPPAIQGFSPLPSHPLPFPTVLVASQNDPYAQLTFARRLAGSCQARFVDVGPLGHINADSNLGDWPEGQSLLAALLRDA